MSGEGLSRPAGQSHSICDEGEDKQSRAGLPGTRRADGRQRQRRENRWEGERERRVKLETLDCAEVGGAGQGKARRWVERACGRWAEDVAGR